MSELQIWERQPDETEAQYRAFQYYLNQELPRSVDAAYRDYMIDNGYEDVTTKTRASGTWRVWQKGYTSGGKRRNVSHTWVERVTAYDNYVSAEFLEEQQRMRGYEQKRELAVTASLLSRFGKLVSKFDDLLDNFDTFVESSSTTLEEQDGQDIVKVVETVGLNVGGLETILKIYEKLAKSHDDITTQRRRALNMVARINETQISNKEGETFKMTDDRTYETFNKARAALLADGFMLNDTSVSKTDSVEGD